MKAESRSDPVNPVALPTQKFSEMRTQLIADLSHELKTPLAAMLTQTQATLKHRRSTKTYRQALELCERNIRGMSELVQRMLDLNGGIHERIPCWQEVNPKLLLQGCIELQKPAALQVAVRIRLVCASGIALRTDPDFLEMMVNHLLGNAIKHSPREGLVTLSCECRADETVLISVRDQGAGISDEDLPHVFDPFYLSDIARTRDLDHGHNVLGLAIVSEYANRLGCTVKVETIPGEGTQFVITFEGVGK